jgi:ribosomal protein S18 acetylase RimI-like enzyme
VSFDVRGARWQNTVNAAVDIAPLRENELGQLFGLAKTAFAGASGWNDRQVLDVLTHDVVFVAHEQGEVGGYVALFVSAGEQVIAEQVFVAPGHEHRGIGHRLLAHAEGYAIARRARVLRIVVEPDNWRARAFYHRLGFVPFQTDLVELILPRVV